MRYINAKFDAKECRMVFGAPKEFANNYQAIMSLPKEERPDQETFNIVTSYPQTAKRFIKEKNLNATINQ